MCLCGHKEQFCQLCSKYKGYFEKIPNESLEKLSIEGNNNEDKTKTKKFSKSNRNKNPNCELCSSKAVNLTDKRSDSEASSDNESRCQCLLFKKTQSLTEKLHAKLNKTLSSIPKFSDYTCYDDYNDSDYDSNVNEKR